MTKAADGPMRLQRYLAAAGVAARRKAEVMIAEGRVKVNGKVAAELGTKIDPNKDHVQVDDEAVVMLDHFYVLFNKPKACITAVSDDRGRPTVMDYLKNLPVPVKPVGRLDFYSEGVLLLTNDGELAAKLLAPASHVPKTYHVKIHGQLGPRHIARLREGVRLDDGTTTLPADIEVLPAESKHTWLAITIHEGKHRQIHRMIEALGYQVDKLQRVAFANLTFHGLRIGDARELSQDELNELRDAVGMDHTAVARGRWHTDREHTDIPRRARQKARDEAEQLANPPPPPPPRPSRDERAPARDDRRPSRDARDARRPRRPDDRAPRRPDDRAPRRPDDRAPRRPDDRAPRRPDDRAPRRPDDRAPRRPDDRAPRRSDDRAPRARPGSSDRKPSRGERPRGQGRSFGKRAR